MVDGMERRIYPEKFTFSIQRSIKVNRGRACSGLVLRDPWIRISQINRVEKRINACARPSDLIHFQ